MSGNVSHKLESATHAGKRPSTSKQFKEPQPSTSKRIPESSEILDDEDFDLQRAIQLSLGNNVDDVSVPSDGVRKLNAQQRQKFSGTIQAHGLIKGFMMEYAEMNSDDIQDLMEATQANLPGTDSNDSFRDKFPHIDDYVLYGTPKKKESEDGKEGFEEGEKEETEVKANESVVITVEPEIMKDFSQEDDLFADVFETSAKSLSDGKEEVPDVEVASISSDDDTIPYEMSQNDYSIDVNKETESGFVSEEGKVLKTVEEPSEPPANLEKVPEDVPAMSENEKFWGVADDPPRKSPTPELSENEKFWANGPFGAVALAVESVPATSKEAEATIKATTNPTSSEVIEIIDDPIVQLKTPVKVNREASPPPSKVPSPFFVNRKTPSSKKKEKEVASVDNSAVAKVLFPQPEVPADRQWTNELRSNKTSEELHNMKDQLQDQQKNLQQERNKMDRMGSSVTQSMAQDCKELLKLFGIPYVNSPSEAEAQCAFLNMVGLTDGTISDDSDMFLFGGQTVYKNFFVQKKIVMEFQHENIDQMFHLDRKKLIQLAMLVGSDYTIGINGIGAVTAIEILAAFPETPEVDGATDEYQSLVSSLRKFREWFNSGKQPGAGGKTVLKSKLKNCELFEGFPNLHVAKAYLEPVVDTNTEKFTWGSPDAESLIEFAKHKLGWTRMKTEEILEPVIKKLNEKKQATIKDYFKSQVTKKFFDSNKLSKRVQKAVGTMGGEEEKVEEKKPKKAAKRKATKVVDVVCLSSDDETSEVPEKKASPTVSDEPTTSKAKAEKPKVQRKRKTKETAEPTVKRTVRIPNTKQVIPQREKEKEEQEKVRKNAIEIFKKSKVSKK